MKKYFGDVLIKFLLECAYWQWMTCDEMLKQHFKDKINATRWTFKKRKIVMSTSEWRSWNPIFFMICYMTSTP